jgi:hypothetical protein
MELAAVWLMAIPGPKMIWQFGELGYDYSIDYGCRVCPKPVRWDYLAESARYRLYQVYGAMIQLKTTYDAFGTTDFNLSSTGPLKVVNLNDDDMNVTILGNFQVTTGSIQPSFQHTGWWYEYFSGDSIYVLDVMSEISLAAGAYRVYTDVRLAVPEVIVDVESPLLGTMENIGVYPNPSDELFYFTYTLHETAEVRLDIYDINGVCVSRTQFTEASGYHTYNWSAEKLAAGVYFARLSAGDTGEVLRIVVE